jgi:hypothetical protein
MLRGTENCAVMECPASLFIEDLLLLARVNDLLHWVRMSTEFQLLSILCVGAKRGY